MDLKVQNILFLTRTMQLGGTENVILQLCEILKPEVNNIVVCSCGGINVEKLTAMGIKHYEIPDIADKNPQVILKTLRIVRKVIKEEEITVVHSHHRMAALCARIVSGKKVVRIANAHNTFKDKKRLTGIAYSGTKIIAVGEQVKKNLVEYFGLPEKQVDVIHNAIKSFDGETIPVAEFEEAKKQGFTLIGNVGRLSEQKGIEYFIQAAAGVIKEFPNVRFYVVGDGEDADKLKRMANELLPEGVLTFLGYRSDIQNVMSQLDFVVLSSLWEGLPLTPIEAFSVGKTVVATAVDGTPEIVKNEVNGLLVKSRDAAGLGSAIIKMCKSRELREKLEKNALMTYLSEFSIDILAKKYIQYYSEIEDCRQNF